MKTKEIPIVDIPELPTDVIWVHGEQVSTAGEDAATVRERQVEAQRARNAEWQAAHGFASALEKQQSYVAPVEDAVQPMSITFTTPRPKAVQKAVEVATQAPTIPHYVPQTKADKLRQWFADADVRSFDREHGTDLYGELQAQRRKEAIFRKASELHLFDNRSDSYKAQLNRLSKAA